MYEFIIPARNEADHIGRIVESMRSSLASTVRIIVVDNGSFDDTASIALSAGADHIIVEPRRGKGFAVVAGVSAAQDDRVFVCDADIVGMEWHVASRMVDEGRGGGPVLTRVCLNREPAAAPVTSLLAIPMMQAFGQKGIREPLGGVIAVDRSLIAEGHLPGNWGFDAAITFLCLDRDIPIVEVPVNGVTHRVRKLSDYIEMAHEVAKAIVHCADVIPWDHSDCTVCVRTAEADTARAC